MNQGFVAKVMRRLNIKTMSISLVCLGVVILGVALNARYLFNVLFGPFPIQRSEVLALADPTPRMQYYVSVQGDDHLNTGYYFVHTSDSGKEKTEAYYHVLFLYDRLLLVKSKLEEIENQAIGALIPFTQVERDDVISSLEREMPEIRGAFLPMMLDATNFRNGGYIGLVVAVILILASLSGFFLGLYRYFEPKVHPAMKALTTYGDLSAVTLEIDSNMSTSHAQVGKRVHFTKDWLVSTVNGFHAVPFRDIIWGYKSVTRHSVNGIPTGKTYSALIYDRFGKLISIPSKQANVDQILLSIKNAAPGTMLGYSDYWAQRWKTERAAIIALVDTSRNRAEPS